MRTEEYDVMGARSRARRLAVHCGECRSGLCCQLSLSSWTSKVVGSLLCVIVNFALSKGEDLVDVFQPVGVAREGEIDQGYAERGDVLNGKIRSGL